jgi:hypothetical protein
MNQGFIGALSLSVAFALLAGCGGSASLIGVNAASPRADVRGRRQFRGPSGSPSRAVNGGPNAQGHTSVGDWQG